MPLSRFLNLSKRSRGEKENCFVFRFKILLRRSKKRIKTDSTIAILENVKGRIIKERITKGIPTPGIFLELRIPKRIQRTKKPPNMFGCGKVPYALKRSFL